MVDKSAHKSAEPKSSAKIIGSIHKNVSERTFVKLRKYAGRTFCDLTVYELDPKTEDYRVSDRGISIDPALIPDLQKLLSQAHASYNSGKDKNG